MIETIYFGTYTRRLSQGIYQADFDTETGQLSNLKLFAAEPSPTYLAFDQENHLYTVGSKDGQGGIAAYQTDGTLLNHVVSEGAPHCFVAVDEKRNLVYGANYHKGQVLVYKRKEDGSLELADSLCSSLKNSDDIELVKILCNKAHLSLGKGVLVPRHNLWKTRKIMLKVKVIELTNDS